MVDWWMLDVKVLVGWCRKMNVGENDRGVVGRGGEGSGSLLRISAEGGLWLINASQRGKKKKEKKKKNEEERSKIQGLFVAMAMAMAIYRLILRWLW